MDYLSLMMAVQLISGAQPAVAVWTYFCLSLYVFPESLLYRLRNLWQRPYSHVRNNFDIFKLNEKAPHCAYRLNLSYSMDAAGATLDLSDFHAAIITSRKDTMRSFSIAIRQARRDELYNHLRAIQRHAKRRSRRTKSPADLRVVRVSQTIRRHFAKLSRKSWRSFCATSNTRKPMSFLRRIAQSLGAAPQQRHSLRKVTFLPGCIE